MNSKLKSYCAIILAGVTGFLAYVAQISPDAQEGLITSLTAIFPPAHRGWIGSLLKAVSVYAGIYATIHAARSGPQSPPVNKPTE